MHDSHDNEMHGHDNKQYCLDYVSYLDRLQSHNICTDIYRLLGSS